MRKLTANQLLLNTSAYNSMALYGQQIKTRYYIDPDNFLQWIDDNFEWTQYNPRKSINRYGLSITS